MIESWADCLYAGKMQEGHIEEYDDRNQGGREPVDMADEEVIDLVSFDGDQRDQYRENEGFQSQESKHHKSEP